jgi:hypothetical protein
MSTHCFYRNERSYSLLPPVPIQYCEGCMASVGPTTLILVYCASGVHIRSSGVNTGEAGSPLAPDSQVTAAAAAAAAAGSMPKEGCATVDSSVLVFTAFFAAVADRSSSRWKIVSVSVSSFMSSPATEGSADTAGRVGAAPRCGRRRLPVMMLTGALSLSCSGSSSIVVRTLRASGEHGW